MFAFGIEGRLVAGFARAHQMQMSDDGDLQGYQRAEVANHIAEIRRYLESEQAILPNAVVLAFDSRVVFTPAPGFQSEWGTPGKLTIPLPSAANRQKCALIIDGQQRIRALADLPHSKSFPILVVGFVAASEDLQREQFILVNSAKSLPKDLLNQLVPDVSCLLPKRLENTRLPTKVVNRVCYRKHSPFYGRVKNIGPQGDIAYASILDVAKACLKPGGALTRTICQTPDGHPDVDAMAECLIAFYNGVAKVWPSAWRLPPERSRLTHGVGVFALGAVLDAVAPNVDLLGPMGALQVAQRLEPLRHQCAWTDGVWPVLERPWKELQNTSADKKLLAQYLVSLV